MDLDDEGKDIDQTKYREIIGSLHYLMKSGLDISYAIGVCAKFQAKLKESHLTTAKTILKCLKMT